MKKVDKQIVNQFNYTQKVPLIERQEVPTGDSETVPNMSMHPKEILRRSTRIVTGKLSVYQPFSY